MGRCGTTGISRNVTDEGGKVVFYKVRDPKRADTGEESPYADAEVGRYLKSVGNVEMVIDIHEHPGAMASKVCNKWSLTSENQQAVKESQEQVEGLRVLPFDPYSRRKTGGEDIPYAITDPDLPTGGLDRYHDGDVTPEMREALNDSVSFVTTLTNAQLKASSGS